MTPPRRKSNRKAARASKHTLGRQMYDPRTHTPVERAAVEMFLAGVKVNGDAEYLKSVLVTLRALGLTPNERNP